VKNTVVPRKQSGKFIQGYLEQPYATAINIVAMASNVTIRELVALAMKEFLFRKAEVFSLTEILDIKNKEEKKQ